MLSIISSNFRALDNQSLLPESLEVRARRPPWIKWTMVNRCDRCQRVLRVEAAWGSLGPFFYSSSIISRNMQGKLLNECRRSTTAPHVRAFWHYTEDARFAAANREACCVGAPEMERTLALKLRQNKSCGCPQQDIYILYVMYCWRRY